MDYSKLRSYEDFSPETQLLREEAAQILRVKLPGFVRQQLRVQLDSNGNLKITGERPIVGNRWSQFRLDFRVPENSDINGIRAKFESGILDLIIPYNKKITPPTVVAAAGAPSTSSPPPPPPPPPPIPAAKKPEPDEPRKQQPEAAALNNRQPSNSGSSANKISQPTPPTSADRFPPPTVPSNNNHNGGGGKDDKQQDFNIARRKKVENFGYDRRDEMETHGGRDEVLQESKFGRNNGYGRFGPAKTIGQRQMLIVNVVVAALVLVGLGMYVFFQNWEIKRTI